MTPDQARALLDGATPGPWIPSRSGYIGSAAGVMIHDGHVLGDTDADTCLIAAAPALAATIAGMTTEYRTEEWQGSYPGWVPTSPWTAEKPAGGTDPNTRIVRRYVTDKEKIS